MQRFARIGFLILAVMASQRSDSQLPKVHMVQNPYRVEGAVLDGRGRPVVGASLDHTGDRATEHKTDVNGRFSFDTRAPAFVVRKAGFRSERVQSSQISRVMVILHAVEGPQSLPSCRDYIHTTGIEGWLADFRFPVSPSIVVSKQTVDVDYAIRTYTLAHSRKHAPVIEHGSGPTWSFGQPMDEYVWASVKYSESDYLLREGVWIIDARGQLEDGRFWRSLGQWGETVSYADVNESTAKQFDSFIDTVCLQIVRQK